MIKIDIILPYKELFTFTGASAVSISVKNSIKNSNFKKNINIFGQFVEKPFSGSNFNGFHAKKFFHFGKNLSILKQYLNKINYDNSNRIIEIHNRPYLFNYLLKNKIKRCVILYFHNNPLTMNGSKSIKQRIRILKNASGIVFVSNFLKNKFLKDIEGEFKNVFVIPNSLDLNLDTKYIQKQNQIVYVGRIVEEKGVNIYTNVLKKLSLKYPDWKFLLIGSTKLGYNNKSSYEKKIISTLNKLGSNVENLGYISNDSVLNIMSKSNILVIPSIWEEPFGMTAIEGLANKMTVIGSQVGGLTEILKDKGILIKDIDDIKLEKQLENLINSPEEIKKYQNLAWNNYPFSQKKISLLQDGIRRVIFDKFNNYIE